MSLFGRGLFAGLFIGISVFSNHSNVFAACGACFIPHTEARHVEGEPNISSGPMINSPTATTLGRNRVSASFIFDTVRYNPIPPERAHEFHEEGRHIHGWLHEESYAAQVGYGILNDLDLYLAGAIVDKATHQIEEHEELGKIENAQGIGDSKLVAKYRFWGKYVEVATLAGVKFPTGKKGDKDSFGNKFETELQPGSGAWDGEFGTSWLPVIFGGAYPYPRASSTS